MEEYEYIVLATDEFISHFVAKTICLENYNDETDYSDDFKKIFKFFKALRCDYKERYSGDICEIDISRLKTEFRFKREEILQEFILELSKIDDSIDYKSKVKEYFEQIEKEDVETLEMQLMVYPYLISLLRNKEESELIQDGKD